MSTHPTQKRWRLRNTEKRNEGRKNNYARRRFGGGHVWTDEETRLIHQSELSDTVLTERLRRSVQAIQVRRAKTKTRFVNGYRR